MEKKEILKICVGFGFFLDKKMLDFFGSFDEGKIKGVVEGLRNFGVKDKILTKEVFDKYKDKVGIRNQESGIRKSGVKILRNFEGNFNGVVSEDFVNYFRKEFEDLRDILIKKDGVINLTSIRRIGRDNGVFSIVGKVFDKRVTKNRNLLFEVEDLTGRIIILVNRENKQLFKQAQTVLLDDVLLFKCSGSSKMLFASEFVYPGISLEKEVFGQLDESVAFVGDLHVGSRYFLEKSFLKFVDWLNGEVGDDRSRGIGRKVKYLVLLGDNIDGVGVYPGQENRLSIKTIRGQYKKLVEILGRLRRDIEVLILPGIHDAVWIGDPIVGIDKKWVKEFEGEGNVKFLSSPSFFEIGGLRFFCYYGSLIKNYRNLISKGEGKKVVELMGEVLKRRSCSGVYGEGDIVIEKEQNLVIDELVDVFVVGGQHRVEIENVGNILNISTSAFQGRTDFEEKKGIFPDTCKVPILNLKSKEIKVLDFSEKEDGVVSGVEGAE